MATGQDTEFPPTQTGSEQKPVFVHGINRFKYPHAESPFSCVPRLGISLQASLLQIVGYRSLVAEVEKLRREPYDSENPEHEDMLMKVQSSLWLREVQK